MRRARRALRRWRHGGRVDVWYHPSYRLPLSGVSHTGMSPRRADDALTWAIDQGIVAEPHRAPLVDWSDLALVHTPGWIERLDRPEALAMVLGVEDGRSLPASELIETWRRATGGTVAATLRAIRERRPAINLLGGFHHAFPDRGIGFCPMNDVAVAIARLRQDGFTGRIVVVDCDAHPPDGLAASLDPDDDVVIASLGVASDWQAGARVIDARVPSGVGDVGYLEALDGLLRELPSAELVFYLAGADPLLGDPFGGLACSAAGLRERDRRVLRWVGDRPIVALPGGGYTEGAWRILAGTVAELARLRIPVEPWYDPVLRRTLDIARTLDLGELVGGLQITEADVLGSLAGPPREPRFLDYYTRHGLEYGLERYGILPALRRMGFTDLRLELETGELPHRLRILDHGAPIADLSLSIRNFGPWRVLYVEWLELRDPRAPSPSDRSRLPGQEAPGLGLATEAGHLLARASERLGLDGVGLIPAWYHVAWMGRDAFRALDPEAQGRFEALVASFADHPLLETTRMLADGIPLDGEVLRWEPIEMVRPSRPELVAALDAQRSEVDRARERWLAKLRELAT